MKSLRTSIIISMISVNILIICLISASLITGFFQINASWEKEITADIASAIHEVIAEDYPGINDITEIEPEKLKQLSLKSLAEHNERLSEITFFATSGELILRQEIANPDKNPDPAVNKPELLRFASEIKHSLAPLKPFPKTPITGGSGTSVGMIEIQSVPLKGMKYGGFFDHILTRSFFIGIASAAMISFLVSIIISKALSRNSRTLAGQLSKLADGDRNINFNRGTTLEMQSSAEAADCLQNQLKHNEQVQLKKLQDIIHDLKTPVAALGIQFEAVRDGILEVDEKRIELLSSEFNRIEDIINELSRYTILSSEDYKPEHIVFNLNILISEAVERFKMQTEQKKQALVFHKPNLPSMVESDKLGMMRVLNNLTANAVNNAPENSRIGITITAQKRIVDKTDFFIIEIENEGRIDESDLPLIFDRLYRSKRSDYRGSGLGLAISKTIVEKNRGKITASNTAAGTVVFRIELPVLAAG